MDFDDYQQAALTTAKRTGSQIDLARFVLGLVGESGEVAEKFKKLFRDSDGQADGVFVDDIRKELGDILWYLAVLADNYDIKLSDIARTNINKLADRQKRGKLGGSGDNR